MNYYSYTVTNNGKRENGTLNAATEVEAAKMLRAQGKSILSLKQTSRKITGSGTGGLSLGKLDGFLISKSSIELALRQLASLLRAGVPILSAVRSIGEHAPARLARPLGKVAESIRQGKALSLSVTEHLPQVGRVTSGLLSVGEANGTIDQMSSYAAELMERSRKIKSQMTQAFAYPVAVMIAAMGVGYYMVNKVFPVIMKFIEKGRGATTLPLPTRIVIWMNDFLTSYGVFVMLLPIAIAVAMVMLRRNSSTGDSFDRIAMRIPALGGAFIFHANTMWCLTLGALLKSGLDVVSAVELVEKTMGNWHYASQLRIVRESLRLGKSLGKSIGETSLRRLCPMAHTMVSVSEESGGMDESLMHVATYYQEQLDRRVALLSKMVEPAIFVVVGGMVGLVYFGFFMAMLSATKAAR